MKIIIKGMVHIIPYRKQFIAYFHFVEWSCINLGISIDIASPNIEIHLPFGFIRIGWQKIPTIKPVNHDENAWRTLGKTEKYTGDLLSN